jgi:hypothetical protein
MKEEIYISILIILSFAIIIMSIVDTHGDRRNDRKIIQLEEKNAFLCKENDSLRMEIDSRDYILIKNHLWDYYK